MLLHWHTEPLLLISLLGLSWGYALLTGPFKKWWSSENILSDRGLLKDTGKLRAVAFHSAVIISYLTVGSPLDQIAEDYLFFAHMIQHMLLVYIIPILFLLGLPTGLVDRILDYRILRKIAKVVLHPVFAGFAFTFVYTLWHIPLLYELALRDKPIHILEHVTMFLTALMMWWPILSRSEKHIPKSPYGILILYAFLLMVGQLPVFAFLSFANVPIYETYVWAPRIIEGLDPLNDQVLGGIIMKVFNMFTSLAIISMCFYKWSVSDADAVLSIERKTVESGA